MYGEITTATINGVSIECVGANNVYFPQLIIFIWLIILTYYIFEQKHMRQKKEDDNRKREIKSRSY